VKKNRLPLGMMLCILLFAMGAGCPGMIRQQPIFDAPVVFQTQPNMQQLIAHVNANTNRIQSLESTGASIGLRGFPSIRSQIYMMPPKKFRLTGETSLTGQLVDIGSNNEEFWVWGRGFQSPGILYARHDQFQYTAASQMLPVEPGWVAQAMGLVRFEPNDFHQGPYLTASGNYEIRSTIQSPKGQFTKVTVIEKSQGQVLEQHVYNAAGQPIASALASNHRYDPTTNTTLPYKVEIRLPMSESDFSIEIVGYRINQLVEQSGTFTRPNRSGVPAIDLAGPAVPFPSGQPGQQVPGTGPQAYSGAYSQPQPQMSRPATPPSPAGYGPSGGFASPPTFPTSQPANNSNYSPSTISPLGSNLPGPTGAGAVRAIRPDYEIATRNDYQAAPVRGL